MFFFSFLFFSLPPRRPSPPPPPRRMVLSDRHLNAKPLARSTTRRRLFFYTIIFMPNFCVTWQKNYYRVLSPVGHRRKPWTMLPLYAEWTGWAVTTRNMALLLLGCCSAVRSRKSRKDRVRWKGRYRFDLASARCPFGTLHLVNLRRPQNRLALLPLMPEERQSRASHRSRFKSKRHTSIIFIPYSYPANLSRNREFIIFYR